jgi:hypothetical protein
VFHVEHPFRYQPREVFHVEHLVLPCSPPPLRSLKHLVAWTSRRSSRAEVIPRDRLSCVRRESLGLDLPVVPRRTRVSRVHQATSGGVFHVEHLANQSSVKVRTNNEGVFHVEHLVKRGPVWAETIPRDRRSGFLTRNPSP